MSYYVKSLWEFCERDNEFDVGDKKGKCYKYEDEQTGIWVVHEHGYSCVAQSGCEKGEKCCLIPRDSRKGGMCFKSSCESLGIEKARKKAKLLKK